MSSLSSRLRIGAALALLLFGLVELVHFLALAVSPSFYPLVVRGALAVLAGLAGLGLWLGDPRAPAAIVALGCVFAAMCLIDALVLGIRPWLFALLTALVAVVAALLLAAWARSEPRPLT
jgi:hypothetical protein